MIKWIKPAVLILLMTFILSLDLPAKAQSQTHAAANTPWPMYQHDPQHSGRSPLLGPTHQPILLWSAQLPDCGGEHGGISIAQDGNLIVSDGGCLFNVDPARRQVIWQFPGYESRGVALVAQDGSFYFGDGPGFSNISAAGEAIWQIQLDDNWAFGSSATFGQDENVYVVHDGVWSFTPEGEFRWVAPYGEYGSHASPAIGLDGNVYAGGPNYIDICAYLPDGSDVAWCAEFDESGGDKTVAVASDGTIYYPAWNHILHALEPGSGDIAWRFIPDGEFSEGSAIPDGIAIAEDGSLRFGANPFPMTSFLYAIDAQGQLMWKVPFSANPLTDFYPAIRLPMTVDRVGNTFLCPTNAACYGIGPDGDVLWETKFPQLDSIDLEPAIQPIIASDGLFYVLDTQQHLYAYADPSLHPALAADHSSLAYEVEPGSAGFTSTLSISSSIAPLTYTVVITPDVGWLSAPASTGTTPAQLTVHFDPQALPAGIYRTVLTIIPTDPPGAWLEIPVTLKTGIRQTFLPEVVKSYADYRILYGSTWFTEYQLVSIKPDGTDRKVITHEFYDTWDSPVYARDGSKVALVMMYEDYRHHIEIYDTTTGALILDLSNVYDNQFPTWSPVCDRLAYFSASVGAEYGDIYAINLDGSGQTRLTASPLNVADLLWSPQGNKIAIDAGYREVYIMNSDGSGLYQVTTGNWTDRIVDWSPDERYLLLGSAHETSNDPLQYGIYDTWTGAYTFLVYPYEIPEMLADQDLHMAGNSQNAVWSPDGQTIAYLGWGDRFNTDVFVINPDGSGKANLTYALDRDEYHPVWSPNGRWIAFSSVDDEISDDPNYDLYIMHPDGSHLMQITTNILEDQHPFWQTYDQGTP